MEELEEAGGIVEPVLCRLLDPHVLRTLGCFVRDFLSDHGSNPLHAVESFFSQRPAAARGKSGSAATRSLTAAKDLDPAGPGRTQLPLD